MVVGFVVVSVCGVLSAALVHTVWELRNIRRCTRRLSTQLESAERLLQRRGELANEVAHEIKNPITAILCSAETLDLLIGEKLDPEHRKSLRYISEYGDHVLRILSDYLDVSRVEAGFLDPKPESTEVEGAVGAVLGLLRSLALRRGVQLLHVRTGADVRAHIDPRILKQILFNLVHNAVKFTPEGGGVEVSARFDAAAGRVEIVVADGGPGMSEELLRTVFDPYALPRRRALRGSADSDGCGLGLALVKLLVESSGGAVTVWSGLGRGSRFTVTLPAAAPPVNREESRGDAPTVSGLVQKPLLGQSFLIVDGDRRSPEAVARLIEAWGGAVDRVGEATDALRALAERRYDAVMIDDPADGEEGSELARVLREDGHAHDTTIIIASVDPIRADLAADSGADRCLSKPFTGHMLLDSLLKSTKPQVTH